MPEDFTFEARDCLTLWESMSKNANEKYSMRKCLGPKDLPTSSLKAVLREWMEDSDFPFEAVHAELSRPLRSPNYRIIQGHNFMDEPAEVDDNGIDDGLREKICRTLLAQLTKAEKSWKESSSKWKATLKEWNDWKREVAKAGKRGPRKVAKKEEGGSDEETLTKADLMREYAEGEMSRWASFNPEYPIDVVEMLFRKGFLRVVIATGTLALGINMPCKTVVFSGDSVFLTALNYRQEAGRAGSRGFDMLGNIHRLISSRLSDINGHFPITTTLGSPFAIRSINALLSQPRLYLGREEPKMTYLLDSRGAPLNFAGCVSHLYYTENSSFASHALLKDGYFHNLHAKIDKNPKAVLRELILIMAHIFGRMCSVVKRSPSVISLLAMPMEANILRRHSSSTLDIFTAYVDTFIKQHVDYPDYAAPITKMKFGGQKIPPSVQNLLRRAPTNVRSSFVALSGHDDAFESIHDLCTTTRSGVFLEEAVVPYVGLYPEESDLLLNAYLYDFFMHRDIRALVEDNRVCRSDIWFVLSDFSMVLATIVTSLSNFMKLTPDSDLDFTEVPGGSEDEEEKREDRDLPPDDPEPTAILADRSSATKMDGWARSHKNDAVKDALKSWEDESDSKPAWDEGMGMVNVLRSFKMLKEDFDTKLKAMWP
ncbi:hypothetical protein CC78DRAFT_550782 [Lojkania enalia]|uniref:Helicase C-terminal domain-containing protein n=1 Tax=Lojkania enalia TaxID=147567 RepID=A0A9P4NA02_9PLEO|nr:hypothetical protein CC78DRAFT_550782 [Didymosphaeria enalia]